MSIDTGGDAFHDGGVRHRRVVIVAFDKVQGLDVFGPADVFYFANWVAERSGTSDPPYVVDIAAPRPGPVVTAAGPALYATRAVGDPDLVADVLLVAGGLEVESAAEDSEFVSALADLARRSGEVGSICTGALLLARAGLLEGRRATTHWALAHKLATAHPDVDVDADRIFHYDGVWTSAGVTAGIDLSLEIVRNHHGSALAAEVARCLVVYLRRAGGQLQYSVHLAAQSSQHSEVADLLAYISDHLQSDLTVGALAERARMSERSFQRHFTTEVGTSPARYVESVRLDAARRLLELTEDGIAAVAHQIGFRNAETLHRSFKRVLGVTPTEYRERFSRPSLPTES
ncbi:helix-turn-helix domain-containing protein [Chryseoglobus sp. 28M-23]|uniref:GlxA family transcriptional regulator n=1 Tax=Chryseoglobus sp. 28M-23 TaxID=2772253 RepID=UPI0017472FC6|nr:helix-turn-helix domain-containing protein [Chryseoglobus sp. 28M-23]QOD93704.1 helix-turn-helix domain-containing protein [Chryseoglobus sp. 28M-23]